MTGGRFFSARSRGAAAGELLSADLEIADFSALGQPLGATELLASPAGGPVASTDRQRAGGRGHHWPLDLRGRPQLLAEMERLHITPGPLAGGRGAGPARVARRCGSMRMSSPPESGGSASSTRDIRADPEGLRMVSSPPAARLSPWRAAAAGSSGIRVRRRGWCSPRPARTWPALWSNWASMRLPRRRRRRSR